MCSVFAKVLIKAVNREIVDIKTFHFGLQLCPLSRFYGLVGSNSTRGSDRGMLTVNINKFEVWRIILSFVRIISEQR